MADKKTVEILVELPDGKTKGYLRRLMAISKYTEMLNNNDTGPEFYENLITFLLGFIVKPEDENEAREALLDASADQYFEMMAAIKGEANPTSAPEQEVS